MAGRLRDHARRDGVGDGVVPFGLNLIHRRLHADGIDFAIGGDGADHHGHVVFAPEAIHDIGEQKGLALGLVDAAHELPAHQRMQLAVLVDGPIHLHQQTRRAQRIEVVMQVAVAPLVLV